MASLNGFNANDVDPNVGFEPIPAGKYLAVIVDSKTKQTKNGAGEYLQLEFEIVDGPYKGRKVWERLTLKHPNETTVKIARGNLSSVCRATGVMQPRDSVELHGIPLTVVVGLKRRDDTGEMTNCIKGYEKREATSPARPSAVTGSPPPWKR
jgi:hypothetical protein